MTTKETFGYEELISAFQILVTLEDDPTIVFEKAGGYIVMSLRILISWSK